MLDEQGVERVDSDQVTTMDRAHYLAWTAASGLLTGALGCGGGEKKADAPADTAAPADSATPAAGDGAAACCKGKNECKAKGFCRVEGVNECKGQNECKGKGGCKPPSCG